MIVARILGCTRVLGKGQGYRSLPLRDEVAEDGTPVMVSAWEPTPDELRALVAGAKVHLVVAGTAHPPVRVEVG